LIQVAWHCGLHLLEQSPQSKPHAGLLHEFSHSPSRSQDSGQLELHRAVWPQSAPSQLQAAMLQLVSHSPSLIQEVGQLEGHRLLRDAVPLL
jgi:hypothetical protein